MLSCSRLLINVAVMKRVYSERLAALEQRAMEQLRADDRRDEVREIVQDLQRRFVPVKDRSKVWMRRFW